MKFDRPYKLKEIADIISCSFVGDEDFQVFGMNEIHRVEEGDIVFVDFHKYYDKALNSNATTILIDKKVDCPKGKALLISDDPFRDFNKLKNYFKPFRYSNQMVSSSAKIDSTAMVFPGVFVGDNVIIGKNTIVRPNVTIGNDTILGDNVTIHSGTIIGTDAFYYKKRDFGYDKLLSSGNVVIENNVEIGANCTIDRGVTNSTIIGEGSKLDNLIQVGHDTIIGKKCLIASQVGIAGCCDIQDNVTIWGQVGVNSGVTIVEGIVVLGQSGITKSIFKKATYFGTPALDVRFQYRQMIKNRNK